jgi:hypothetical protein
MPGNGGKTASLMIADGHHYCERLQREGVSTREGSEKYVTMEE